MAAAAAAARSLYRPSTLRSTVSRVTSGAPRRLPGLMPAAPRILRSPVELSFCVESLMPLHSATASSLMTSMLAVSRRGCGWLSEVAIARALLVQKPLVL